MARWMDMVDDQPKPAPLRGGVEVRLVAYWPVAGLPIRQGPGGRSGLPSATLLINFADEPGTRSAFAALDRGFPSARVALHVFEASNAAADLLRLLRSAPFANVDAVIFGANANVALPTLQALVDALRIAASGLVVVVGDECAQWPAMRGVSGFVRGSPATTAATAMTGFSLVAALSAPRTLTCLDHEDVGAALGTVNRPAVLVEAVWLREDRRLVCVRAGDSEAISRARAITCHLVASDLRMAEMRSMMNALRAIAAADCEITYQAPVNADLAPFFHPNIGLMTMICKDRGEDAMSS